MIEDMLDGIVVKDIKLEDGGLAIRTSDDNVSWLDIKKDTAYAVSYDYDTIFEEIASRFNKQPVLKHECHGCGATLEIDCDKHIFVCKYCGASYAIGTQMINS